MGRKLRGNSQVFPERLPGLACYTVLHSFIWLYWSSAAHGSLSLQRAGATAWLGCRGLGVAAALLQSSGPRVWPSRVAPPLQSLRVLGGPSWRRLPEPGPRAWPFSAWRPLPAEPGGPRAGPQ